MSSRGEPWLLRDVPTIAIKPTGGRWLSDRIGSPPAFIRQHIKAQGLEPRELGVAELELFEAAEDMIALVPSLSAIVEAAVGEVYLLKAEAGYDISHSEPRWKSLIFVSVPDRTDSVGALRVAESVVHEAMHLQLTIFENATPIVADKSGTMTSPWRRKARPFRGVAHGLFVFSCLSAYFKALVDFTAEPASSHLQARIDDIRAEVATINLGELARGLTPTGGVLARRWYDIALANAA